MVLTRAAAARLAQRSWNDMLLEILVLVLELLPCVIDRNSFAATCKGWSNAVRQAGALPAQLPLAVLPSPGAAATVFSMLSGSMRRIHLPSNFVGTRLCGSHPGGWLAVAGDLPSGGNRISVVKNITGEIVPLPNQMLVELGRGRGSPLLGYTDMHIQAISFSTDPSSRDCLAAAITGGGYPGIAMRDAGAEYMPHTWISSTRKDIEDILFFNGPAGCRFHIITNKEDLVATSMGIVQVDFFRYDVRRAVDQQLRAMPKSIRVIRYLVESRGKLLMVRRYYWCSRRNGLRKTLYFRVFQWQTTEGMHQASSWLELRGLNGRVLFLARGCSRSFDEVPHNSDIPAGSIYFFDDTRLYAESGNQQNTDMGVYYMGEEGQNLNMTPNLCSPIYGTQNYVVMVMKHEGNMKIKLFEHLQQLTVYVRKSSAAEWGVPTGCLWRFIHEPASNCSLPPIWFAH